ncbi:MAG: 30S ribosomal protein S2 [Bacteroidia bacterium]|nr:30S ribosomal protein S2 [Bacteroidia bacterium]NNM15704.1 30S ribosomal protein S2 [Bacteroidia bacterium]
MQSVSTQELLDAGVHFGHLKRKWNPKMSPYIFMERNGIHIIDLNKTSGKLDEAAAALKQVAKSGKKILFVATKKQAKEIVSKAAESVNMPYITERWPGGMLTNFATIRKSIKKMGTYDKMAKDGTFDNISKKERLQISRQKAKLETFLGSISDMNRIPATIFIVDVNKEHIAVSEAKKLNIPTIAICDTNTDPTQIDFPIPANDDATKSIKLIMDIVVGAVQEGLSERKASKEQDREKQVAAAEKKADEQKTEIDPAAGEVKAENANTEAGESTSK